MADVFSKAERSRVMASVKGKDTKPEIIVRRLVHGMGYRYRLYRGELPGRPDLVFAGRGKVIFVHGCFWHQHGCRRGGRRPAANRAYWRRKLERNVERDAAHVRRLRRMGWRVMIVWECQTAAGKRAGLARRIVRFMER
ncbi:MAG: DNA mismatch endonuclease Vsr [Planctomycetes bacterium]|nr:DNA mismatch endonuclease Vsr [Planctomycetota bacterium]